MGINKGEIIDIPTKTFLSKKRKENYVYAYTNFYRNEEGKPRNRSICIGKAIPNTNQMNPNDNYYAYYKIERKQKEYEVYDIGYAEVVEQCFMETGLEKILSSVYGSDIAECIKVISAYLVNGGKSMNYIDDFLKERSFGISQTKVTSQRISEIFAEIMDIGTDSFFKKWIRQNTKSGYICYDITSISTYSDWITRAEYGYNRDHEKLRQINLGLFTAENTKTPVYYEIYNGSLTDKSNLISVVKNAQIQGLRKIKLVMDGGFFDETRLKELKKLHITFTVGMPGYLQEAKKILKENKEDLFTANYTTDYANTFGKLIDYEMFGIQGKVFVGLDTNTRNLQLEDLKSRMARYTDELKHGRKKYSTVIKYKKYTELFEIKPKETSNYYTFELDQDKTKQMSENYGYFLIFTTDSKATANDIIYYYREKDIDEKMFYALKNYSDMNRLKTHSQKTTDGKIFVTFISLILRSWMNQKLYDYKKGTKLTLKKIIYKLDDIKVLHSKKECRYLKTVTKEQRNLMQIFGLNTEDLEKKAKKKLR